METSDDDPSFLKKCPHNTFTDALENVLCIFFLLISLLLEKKKLPKESSWLLSHKFESTRIKSVLIEIRGETHKLFSDYFKETKGEECNPLDWFVYQSFQ
jgi:hypothetical protein